MFLGDKTNVDIKNEKKETSKKGYLAMVEQPLHHKVPELRLAEDEHWAAAEKAAHRGGAHEELQDGAGNGDQKRGEHAGRLAVALADEALGALVVALAAEGVQQRRRQALPIDGVPPILVHRLQLILALVPLNQVAVHAVAEHPFAETCFQNLGRIVVWS